MSIELAAELERIVNDDECDLRDYGLWAFNHAHAILAALRQSGGWREDLEKLDWEDIWDDAWEQWNDQKTPLPTTRAIERLKSRVLAAAIRARPEPGEG